MKVMIVGGGRVGKSLAKLLLAEKQDVVLIETDQKIAEQLAGDLDALVINEDGTDEEALERAGIKECEVIVAATYDDKTNLLVTEIAKMKKVNKIIAVVTSPRTAEFVEEIGATPVDATTLTVNSIHKDVSTARAKSVVAHISQGKASILKFHITQKSPFLGKKIGDLALGRHVFWLEREGEAMLPDTETQILEGDSVYLISSSGEARHLSKAVLGE